ncbi:MAG: pentapeptide repeat-containing protein [Candidatus Woesearchaeota archaeon]
MTEKQIRFYLRKVGYQDRSIVAIWYRNPSEVRGKLDKYLPTLGQKIETIIRWYTDDGIKALGEIRTFIKRKINEASDFNSREMQKGSLKFKKTVIDFNELFIEGQSINEYMYSKINHLYRHNNWNDLSGIPLTNLSLDNAIIANAQLSNAIFDNSNFYNVEFINCNLHSCSFKNCHSSTLFISGDRGAFSDCDWRGSLVNNIDISSKNIGINPIYKKISYFKLLGIAIKGDIPKNYNHTHFSACQIFDDNTTYQFRKHIDYINWYQSTLIKYSKLKTERNIFIRIFLMLKNLINAATSMNWYSPFSTLFTGGLVILLFSFIYYFLINSYYLGIENYWQSLNFSLQIFTNLGFGIIKPILSKGILGNTLVSVESALGYFWLALTIMVFSKKIYR